MGQIRLIGSKTFIEKTREALNLLKEKDYFGYKVVIKYLGAIVENKTNIDYSYFDAYKEVPTAFIRNTTYMHNKEWYAAALVHEAYHGKLFSDTVLENKNPENIYNGYHAEMYCLTQQIECLKKVGAREEDILYAISCYDKTWWVDEKEEVNLINLLRKIKGVKSYGDNR